MPRNHIQSVTKKRGKQELQMSHILIIGSFQQSISLLMDLHTPLDNYRHCRKLVGISSGGSGFSEKFLKWAK